MKSNLNLENNVFEKSSSPLFPVVCSSPFYTTGKDLLLLEFIMQCYRVKNWNEIYEINRTREIKKMSWLPVPIKLDGDGYTQIMSDPDGANIFGAWIAMLEVAAHCKPRGTLIRGAGIPHDAAGISRVTRVPEKIVKKMLDFCYKKCNWLEIIEIETTCDNPALTCDNPALTCAVQDIDYIDNRDNITERECFPAFRECSELLKKRILERRQQKITDTVLKSWDNEVRLMVERDKRTLDQIKQLINQCHDMEPTASGFTWRDNILSMGKLRERWNDGKIYLNDNKNKTETHKHITPQVAL